MKKDLKILLNIALVLFVSACDVDEWANDFPKVNTIDVTGYTDTSAMLVGEIEELGNNNIIEVGFMLEVDFKRYYIPIENYDFKRGKFKLIIGNYLRKDKTYSCSAYAKTNDYTVLGNSIEYNCTLNIFPEIVSIIPISANLTAKRTMVVKNFIEEEYYAIRVGNLYVYSLSVVAPNTIEFILPITMQPGAYTVEFINDGRNIYSQELIITE